jgi:D-arabinose 1-dehydrogenase-like Zn-dependent alcohol dehydrogenase
MLLCAGITTFNALRHSGAMPGDLVAVQGIGGLGHLGVQFASKFGLSRCGHQWSKRSGSAGEKTGSQHLSG